MPPIVIASASNVPSISTSPDTSKVAASSSPVMVTFLKPVMSLFASTAKAFEATTVPAVVPSSKLSSAAVEVVASVTAPLATLKSSELNEAIPLLDVVASSPVIVIVLPVAEVSTPSPPDIVKVSLSKSIAIVPLSVVASKSCAVTCAST